MPVMMGSGVFIGAFTLDHASRRRTSKARRWARLNRSATPASEARRRDRSAPTSRRTSSRVRCSRTRRKTIGVVTGALGLALVRRRRHRAGSARRPDADALRKDALVAAAQHGEEVNALAHRHPPNGRGTVGFMQVKPNSRNVIPGEVRFSVDLRHAEDAQLDTMDAEMRAMGAELAAAQSAT